MRRAMLLECSAPHWLPVMKRLQVDGVATPIVWTAWHAMQAPISSAFPDCLFIDTIHSKRALGPNGAEWHRKGFDDVCAKIFEKEAFIVLDMMNRFDTSRDFHMVDRSTLFYQLLIYWRMMLDEHRPDIVIFPAPPHVVYDYIVLCLCRELGIRTIMMEEATIVPPHRINMPDYTIGDVDLAAAVSKVDAISPVAIKIADTLRGAYKDAKPSREVEAHARRDEAEAEGVSEFARRIEAVFNHEMRHEGLTSSENPKTVNASSLEKELGVPLRTSFEGPYANTRHLLQQHKSRQRTERFKGLYNELATPLHQIAGPFVYVPLAGQPERTSNPQAGIFANQLVMVNVLASNVPTGWRVVVKEHPNQFHPLFAVNMCRSEEYYLELASLDNVSIIRTDEDPFETIDRSAAVATTGGTSALEAVARGKPALLFGDAWYRDCPGVERIRSFADANDFFNRWPVSVLDGSIERFVQAVINSCPEGIGDYPPEGYVMDEDRNVENLAKSITDRLSIPARSTVGYALRKEFA